MADMKEWPCQIPCSGFLCEGDRIVLVWPEKEDYDRITELRNSPDIRRWFVDNRPIDRVKNRKWIASDMKRPVESLLTIRGKKANEFLGTIGWTDWNTDLGSAVFGRLAIDPKARNLFDVSRPTGALRVALDAAIALRDYAFHTMQLDVLHATCLVGNQSSERLICAVGFVKTNHKFVTRPQGDLVEVAEMAMPRKAWEAGKRVTERNRGVGG